MDEPPPPITAPSSLGGRNLHSFTCADTDSPVTTSTRDNGTQRRLARLSRHGELNGVLVRGDDGEPEVSNREVPVLKGD